MVVPRKRIRQDVKAETTEHGFRFGSALVEALAHDSTGGVWIGITTQQGRVQIRVTPCGNVKVFPDAAPSKKDREGKPHG